MASRHYPNFIERFVMFYFYLAATLLIIGAGSFVASETFTRYLKSHQIRHAPMPVMLGLLTPARLTPLVEKFKRY